MLTRIKRILNNLVLALLIIILFNLTPSFVKDSISLFLVDAARAQWSALLDSFASESSTVQAVPEKEGLSSVAAYTSQGGEEEQEAQETLEELVVTERAETFVRLKWPGSEHEGQMVVDYSVDASTFVNHGLLNPDATGYAAGGLACGMSYHFKVYGQDAKGRRVPNQFHKITVSTVPCERDGEPPPPLEADYVSCGDLDTDDLNAQIALVEAKRECVDHFIYLLENNPQRYLDAFYKLISSSAATDGLFAVVYDEIYANRFHFPAHIVESLYANFPRAVAVCVEHERCPDWTTYILPALQKGDLYQCPDVNSLDEEGLLASLPYSNYACTEATAKALTRFTTPDTLTKLVSLAANEERSWARRNVLRVMGRLGQDVEVKTEQRVSKEVYLANTQAQLLDILAQEENEQVLHEAIWILDSAFYPFFSMQPQIEEIIQNPAFDSMLRFRAMSSLNRLLQAKEGLMTVNDLTFIASLLDSDEVWVRAIAAFTLEVAHEEQLNASRKAFIVYHLENAWEKEEELIAQAYFAKAIDHYEGSQLHETLRNEYEGQYLANQLEGDQITIHSGLTPEELPAFITLMNNQQRAFFEIMGDTFQIPLNNDVNERITLMLFATQKEYAQYMDAFVGYGSHAGGLYIEKEGILYTYQRDAEQSSYTVEQLVQHEFAHYLLGRYVYPGIWTDADYHEQLKGWSDEGFAEFLATLTFDENGQYQYAPREVHLHKLCDSTYRNLHSLLTQSEGYNEPGVFDYSNGWSFIYYLMTERASSAINLYSALRNDSYKIEDFAAIAGVSSISELESEWHRSLDATCATFDKDANTTQSDITHNHNASSNNPYGETNGDIILHVPDVENPPDLVNVGEQ